MVSLKRFSLLLFGLLLTVFIAACGPATTNTGSMTTGTTMTNTGNTTANNNGTTMNNGNTMNNNGNAMGMATPTMGAQNNNNMMGNATPTVAAQNNMGQNNNMGNMNAFILTAKVTLNGKPFTVLTNAKGMMLYYYLVDPKPQSACTGQCAKDWPPVLVTDMNMMTVTSSMQLPHKLTIVKTANGNQVEYHGHPLYTYAGDMKAGQFLGRGMDNAWYLVSINL